MITDRGPNEQAPETETPSRPKVQSAARAVQILLAVAKEDNGLTARQISEALGISRQTTYHLLHTLAGEGVLRRGERGRYELGLAISKLAEGFERQLSPALLKPFVQSLATATGEMSYGAMRRGQEMVVTVRINGSHPINVHEGPLGPIDAPHARASGKVLLAYAPQDVQDFYLDGELIACTPQTRTDPEVLREEFAQIREQGYWVDSGEFAEGVCCVAAAVGDGLSPFVLSLSTPIQRFEANATVYLEAVRAAARAAGAG
jgi:IclR family transcriptional regulator, acetate operon repressor